MISLMLAMMFAEIPTDLEDELVVYTTEEELDGEVNGLTYKGTYQLTAYCATGNRCADGAYPTEGYTVASNDPSIWHKWIYIEGVGWRFVHDTGGMASNVLDIYINLYSDCIRFGRRSGAVYVYD